DRFSSRSTRNRIHHHTNTDAAARGSTYFRYPGRPLRAAYPADDRHHLLFGNRIAHGLLTKLYYLPSAAWALWHRYGWRMGSWFIAGYGDITDSIKRPLLWYTPARLRLRLSACSSCLLPRLYLLPLLWMAYYVCARRSTSI